MQQAVKPVKINRLSSGSSRGLHGMFGVTAQQYHLRHCRIAAAIADRPEVPSDADGSNWAQRSRRGLRGERRRWLPAGRGGRRPTGADGIRYLWPGTTALSGIREFAANAESILAVGTCAAFGGVAASVPPRRTNPTWAQGVSAIVTGKTVMNVSGCPPHPDWIVGTIASYCEELFLLRMDTAAPRIISPTRSTTNVPMKTVLRTNIVWKTTAARARSHGNCPSIKWNGIEAGRVGIHWCVGAGSPCHGCTHPSVPDGMLPFHAEIRTNGASRQ